MRKRGLLGGLSLALALIICFGVCGVAHAAELIIYCEPASAVPGDTVTFNLQITNSGQYAMQNLSYSSDYSGVNNANLSFSGPRSVAPGEKGVYSGAVAMTDAMLDVPINFTLHWEYFDAAGNSMGTDNATGSVTVARGAGVGTAALPVTVDRVAGGTQASIGEVIPITYTLQNLSGAEITKLSIKDAELSKTELVKDITVAPGALYSFLYEYTMGRSTVESAPVFMYTLNGEAQTASVEPVSLGMINTRLTVEVEQGPSTAEGVTFTLYLTNNGNQKISKIKITDEQGNAVNSDTFALSVGESRTFPYTVANEEERNVVFHLSGSAGTGEAYEDNTKTFTVRRYIDPSLIGLEFSASVLETLNQNGSLKVRFTVNNTGSLPLHNLVLSEQEFGEIRRQESVPLGETILEETINVGAPRDMVFTVNVQDEARNDYTYTANINAAYVGVDAQPVPSSGGATNAIDEIETIGTAIGSSVSNALTISMVILSVLCVLSAIALIVLSVLEKRQKQEAARRRVYRNRQMRAAEEQTRLGRGAQPMNNDGYGYAPGDTLIQPGRRPRE